MARRKYPDQRFVISNGMGKEKSTENAFNQQENTIRFWVIPIEKVNRCFVRTSISVACMVVDEYNIKTPRQKADLEKSFVCHTIINQATWPL